MIITPHMLVGAVIGVQSPNVWTAFCFGLISHYILDFLPHWDYLNSLKVNNKLKMFTRIGLDSIIGVIIVFVLIWDYPQKLIIMSALIGSLLPDILEFFYANLKMKWFRPFHNFHLKIHYWKGLSFLKGMPITLIICLSAIFILVLHNWG